MFFISFSFAYITHMSHEFIQVISSDFCHWGAQFGYTRVGTALNGCLYARRLPRYFSVERIEVHLV